MASRLDSAKRRDSILRAASDLFETRGYYGTSMRTIAHKAGITPSLLQKYYPTKELMLHDFVERAVQEFITMEKTLERLVRIADTREMLRAVGHEYIAFLGRMRGFYTIWLMCPELVAPYAEWLPEHVAATHEVLARSLAQRGHFSLTLARRRVRMFLGSLFTWTVFYRPVGIAAAYKEREDERLARVSDAVLRRARAGSGR